LIKKKKRRYIALDREAHVVEVELGLVHLGR